MGLKHYLELFQKYLYDQYYLVFLAVPKKKAGFQRINVETEVANSEIAAPDNLWVPAAGTLRNMWDAFSNAGPRQRKIAPIDSDK